MHKAPAALATVTVAALFGCDRPAAASSSRGPTLANHNTASSSSPTVSTPAIPPPSNLQALLRAGGIKPPLRPLLRRGWGTLWGFETTRNAAIADRASLRAAALAAGYYPIIFCDQHSTAEEVERTASPDEVLAAAESVDAREKLRASADELLDDESPDFDTDDPAVQDDDTLTIPSTIDVGKTPLNIMLVPTTRPWAIMAYLQMGNWNDNPEDHVHVAVMKYWHDHYGAEPVAIASDIIEMSVARPPSTPEACRALALEQFAYTAGDLVYQGYEHFGTLARILRNRKHWFFWWD